MLHASSHFVLPHPAQNLHENHRELCRVFPQTNKRKHLVDESKYCNCPLMARNRRSLIVTVTVQEMKVSVKRLSVTMIRDAEAENDEIISERWIITTELATSDGRTPPRQSLTVHSMH